MWGVRMCGGRKEVCVWGGIERCVCRGGRGVCVGE